MNEEETRSIKYVVKAYDGRKVLDVFSFEADDESEIIWQAEHATDFMLETLGKFKEGEWDE